MGVFNLVVIALFAIGSFARDTPLNVEGKAGSSLGNSVYGGKQWVVLVAGTSGWNKYSNQADICHAYQIVKSNGIPEENIITMMVDDIARNIRNPMRGKIYNKPHLPFLGKNVYKGVNIDYSGSDVNSENFLNIITGNKTAMENTGTGKVVEGGPHDTIFVNFVTYGGKGFLSFPDSLLFADELDNAFNEMYANGKYGKVVAYVESSFAGSMFDGILNEKTDIMAVTASGPREESYACYYVKFPYYTFLGDCFSVAWMEHLDLVSGDLESLDITVFEVFNNARQSIDQSNIMIYGDYSVGYEPISVFIGYPEKYNDEYTKPISKKTVMSGISSRNANEYSVKDQLTKDKLTILEKKKLENELSKNNQMRSVIDNIFRDIYSKVMIATPEIKEIVGEYDAPNNQGLSLNVFPCYRSIINTISERCFSLPQNPYSLDRLNVFANLCAVDNQIHQLVNNLVGESCSNIPNNIMNVF